MKKLSSLLGNSVSLDGGAMFGNAPKAMWEQWIPADEHNRITMASRSLLVDDEGKKILFETGIGAFFDPKLKDRYGVVEDDHRLLTSLTEAGLDHDEIDVVVLSHLHFDHAGGLLAEFEAGAEKKLLFPNATFVVGQECFERAKAPHARDRASFIKELPVLLEESGRLEVIQGPRSETLGDDYHFHYSNGHTPGMLLCEIKGETSSIVFCADLIPGVPWVHLPITMGYDRYAELVIDEKKKYLTDFYDRRVRLFFTHDHDTASAMIARDEKGRFRAAKNEASFFNQLLA